jgi:hypothetical protein
MSMQAQRVGGGIAPAHSQPLCRKGRVVPGIYSQARKRNDTHWVGLGAGLDGQGKSRPIEIRSPDRPAPSESPICYSDRLFILGINSFKMDCILYTFLYGQVYTFYSNCGYTCCAARRYANNQGKIMFLQ